LAATGAGKPLRSRRTSLDGWRKAMTDEAVGAETGIDPAGLADEDLFRELSSLHRTRLQTLRHGPDAALENHLRRTAELETEYLARYPGREVDPARLTQDF
jgi:Family of unknown function (DUF6158)